jgi:hypothetical protein
MREMIIPPHWRHDSERCYVDELAEKQLMEMLEEMKVHQEDIGIQWEGVPVPEPEPQKEDKVEKEAEEQFMDDAEEGGEDVLEQGKMEAIR